MEDDYCEYEDGELEEIAEEPEDEDTPVSYTHLDVYKRQVETDLKLSGCVSADTLAALRAEGLSLIHI